MSVIWIIEAAEQEASSRAWRPGLAAALIGDFAVRAFASAASFRQLLKLSRCRLPDLLLIDGERLMQAHAAKLGETLREHLPATPVIYAHTDTAIVQSGLVPALRDLPQLHMFQAPVEGLPLSAFVEAVLLRSAAADQRSKIRYRSVLLDVQRLECLVGPEASAVGLPRKEAQLLRLLLERPGVCLSREEIQEAIWQKVHVTPRTIDSHVSRLRRRLAGADVEIISVYGGGYVLR